MAAFEDGGPVAKAGDEILKSLTMTTESWERERSRKIANEFCSRLIGIRLNPEDAAFIYNRLVASTWPSPGDGFKWPPEPRLAPVLQLETERRIKE